MKIYRTRTQEDYNSLMVELDKQGCSWEDGDRLSVFNAWNSFKGDTYIKNDGRLITYDTIETYERLYPNTPIIEYTAEKQGEKQMIIYRVKTQADYDALMIELEEKGYKWYSGYKPTSQNYWSEDKENSCIKTSDKHITFGSIEWHKKNYPDVPIIEYKEKGETDNFIKELTVKIYYNEITKKHYNSYEDAIADCKKEMERQHDKN